VNFYEEAVKVMPGGVSSPVRAFKAVGGTPLFIKKDMPLKYMIQMIENILIMLCHMDL